MNRVLAKILAVALFTAGISTLHVHASSAQSLDIYIDGDRPAIQYRDRDRRNYNDQRRGGCSERQAIRRAYQYGMRDPAIRSSNRRLIVVDGIGRRGEYTNLQLANRQGCPRVN